MLIYIGTDIMVITSGEISLLRPCVMDRYVWFVIFLIFRQSFWIVSFPQSSVVAANLALVIWRGELAGKRVVSTEYFVAYPQVVSV